MHCLSKHPIDMETVTKKIQDELIDEEFYKNFCIDSNS